MPVLKDTNDNKNEQASKMPKPKYDYINAILWGIILGALVIVSIFWHFSKNNRHEIIEDVPTEQNETFKEEGGWESPVIEEVVVEEHPVVEEVVVEETIEREEVINQNSSQPSRYEFTNPIKMKTNSEAKIRDKPDVLGNIIGYIPNSTLVLIVGKEKEYWKVNYNGRIGYSNEMYFDETFSNKNTGWYSEKSSNYNQKNITAIITYDAKLKDKPKVYGDIITVILKGEVVNVIGFEEDYWKVNYNGNIGYLFGDMYFKVTDDMKRFK